MSQHKTRQKNDRQKHSPTNPALKTAASGKSKSGRNNNSSLKAPSARVPKKTYALNWLVYAIGFILLWIFTSIVYGDVFWRTEQSSYVSDNAVQMKFVTDLGLGWLYYSGRWVLTLFKYPSIGGLLLSAILTATAWMLNYILRLPMKWWPCGFVLPILICAYYPLRSFNLYFRSEPSWVFLLPIIVLTAEVVVATIMSILRFRSLSASAKKRTFFTAAVCFILAAAASVTAYSLLPSNAARGIMLFVIVLALAIIIIVGSSRPKEGISMGTALISGVSMIAVGICCYILTNDVANNEIKTARMTRMLENRDWDGMIEEALSAKQPTRSIAGYYAIALEETGQILTRLFELPFEYPDIEFDADSKNEEYGLFTADCNFAAGITNPAYHYAFEQTVMGGQTLHHLKLMALCAIMNHEKELAEKYMTIISKNPFEDDFIAQYSPMINNPKLIDQDERLTRIKKLQTTVMNRAFEQNFQKPTFIGYSIGHLPTSAEEYLNTIASLLYSKDLQRFISIAAGFEQNNIPMPECVKQAIAVYIVSKPDGQNVAQQFPDIANNYRGIAINFLTQAQPIIKRQQEESRAKGFKKDANGKYLVDDETKVKNNKEMRDALKDTWLGTYYYYYFCENNNPNQVQKPKGDGVN